MLSVGLLDQIVCFPRNYTTGQMLFHHQRFNSPEKFSGKNFIIQKTNRFLHRLFPKCYDVENLICQRSFYQ